MQNQGENASISTLKLKKHIKSVSKSTKLCKRHKKSYSAKISQKHLKKDVYGVHTNNWQYGIKEFNEIEAAMHEHQSLWASTDSEAQTKYDEIGAARVKVLAKKQRRENPNLTSSSESSSNESTGSDSELEQRLINLGDGYKFLTSAFKDKRKTIRDIRRRAEIRLLAKTKEDCATRRCQIKEVELTISEGTATLELYRQRHKHVSELESNEDYTSSSCTDYEELTEAERKLNREKDRTPDTGIMPTENDKSFCQRLSLQGESLYARRLLLESRITKLEKLYPDLVEEEKQRRIEEGKDYNAQNIFNPHRHKLFRCLSEYSDSSASELEDIDTVDNRTLKLEELKDEAEYYFGLLASSIRGEPMALEKQEYIDASELVDEVNDKQSRLSRMYSRRPTEAMKLLAYNSVPTVSEAEMQINTPDQILYLLIQRAKVAENNIKGHVKKEIVFDFWAMTLERCYRVLTHKMFNACGSSLQEEEKTTIMRQAFISSFNKIRGSIIQKHNKATKESMLKKSVKNLHRSGVSQDDKIVMSFDDFMNACEILLRLFVDENTVLTEARQILLKELVSIQSSYTNDLLVSLTSKLDAIKQELEVRVQDVQLLELDLEDANIEEEKEELKATIEDRISMIELLSGKANAVGKKIEKINSRISFLSHEYEVVAYRLGLKNKLKAVKKEEKFIIDFHNNKVLKDEVRKSWKKRDKKRTLFVKGFKGFPEESEEQTRLHIAWPNRVCKYLVYPYFLEACIATPLFIGAMTFWQTFTNYHYQNDINNWRMSQNNYSDMHDHLFNRQLRPNGVCLQSDEMGINLVRAIPIFYGLPILLFALIKTLFKPIKNFVVSSLLYKHKHKK